MDLLAATGSSKHHDTEVASSEAVKSALSKLSGKAPDLALVFASVYYDQQRLLETIAKSLPEKTKLIGCSDAGEITEEGPAKKSVAIMLLAAPGLTVVTAHQSDLAKNPKQSSQAISQAIGQQLGREPKLLCLFPDGLVTDGAAVVSGVASGLGGQPCFVGAASGDDFHFEKSYQYWQTTVLTNSIVAFALDGDFHCGIGVRHGWKSLGRPHQVTRATGNIIYEIEGEPAITLYHEYFGKEKIDMIGPLGRLAVNYPLGIRSPAGQGWLIRDPFFVRTDGSIRCAAAIPQDSEVYVMISGKEETMAAAKAAASEALSNLGESKPKAIINFNCIAKNRIFGVETNEEIQAILETIGSHVPLVGCYSYGQLASLREKERLEPYFLNETTVLLVLGD